MTVKDPQTDSITTIKPTGRDYYESTCQERGRCALFVPVGLELRDETCKFMYNSGDGSINALDERTLEEYQVPVIFVSDTVLSLLESK
jgi:hypothetical protein